MATPCGYEQITGLSAVKGLTVPKTAKNQAPTYCIFQAEAFPIRWRDDGTAPTSTVGMTLAVGSSHTYTGDLNAIRFIESTVGGIINVTYYY